MDRKEAEVFKITPTGFQLEGNVREESKKGRISCEAEERKLKRKGEAI